MSSIRVVALTVSELRAELRAGEVLLATAPFAVAGLLVTALAVGADVPLLRRIGPGIYWAVVVLFGSLVTLRRTLVDQPDRRDLLVLLGIDPVEQWTSRVAASTLLLATLQAVLLPAVIVLYDPPLVAVAAQGGVALAASVGIAGLGTLVGDLAASERGRGTLVPMLVTPFTVPLVLAGVQVQEAGVYGAPVWPWVAMSTATALTVVLAGWLTARPLQETTP